MRVQGTRCQGLDSGLDRWCLGSGGLDFGYWGFDIYGFVQGSGVPSCCSCGQALGKSG